MANEILLKGKIVNYANITKPDKDGFYRVSVELTETDIDELTAAAEEEGLKIGRADEKIPGDMISPKTAYEPVICFDKAVENTEIYSGCICDVVVSPFEYVYKKRKGVSFGLRAICKRAEGERLDNRKNATDYFDGDIYEAFE